MIKHFAQRMLADMSHIRVGLGVAGQADLDGDALAGDVLGKLMAIRHF